MAKILMLLDLVSEPPFDNDYSQYLKTPEWEIERDLWRALRRMGHEVKILGLFDQIDPLIKEIQTNPPDVVFNLCESFNNRREMESNVIALLELLGAKYTGAGPEALRLCQDKGMTKKILKYHDIPVPDFVTSQRSHPLRTLKDFKFPAFIKPLGLEGSEGIDKMSFAENEEDALERVRYIHEKLEADAIIEEYIEGREIYISLLGNDRPTVLPPREIFFGQMEEGDPKFASFKAKWDEGYRKKWGIRNGPAKEIDEKVLNKMTDYCRKIYRLFHVKGYARCDLRLKEDGEFYFLEINPNPSIASWDDFTKSAEKAGMSYEELLDKIISLA